MTKHDVIGIVMGIPAFLAGIWGLAMLGHTMLVHAPQLQYGVIGGIPLLISFGLFIPSRLYEHSKARVVGFAAFSLTNAVTAYCAVFLGWGVYESLSDPPQNGEMRWIMTAMAMFWCLIALVLAGSGIWVLLKKLKPRPILAAIAIAVGIAAAIVLVVLM